MNKVFFSYSTKNQEIANKLVEALVAVGLIIWQDWHNIEAADNWLEKIEQGLAQSSAFILLWSANAAASPWVKDEIQITRNEKGDKFRIISVCLDDTPLPPALKLKQFVSLPVNFNADELKSVVRQITKALNDLQYPNLAFQFTKSLGEQLNPVVGDDSDTHFVSVPFLDGGLTKVSVVGTPTLKIKQPPIAQLILQLTRSVSENMLEDVFTTLGQIKFDEQPVAFVGLHVTGPNDGKTYTFDNYRPAEWANTLGAIEVGVDRFLKGIGGTKPVLQIFVQSPAALSLGIGRIFDKYWRIQMFNWVRPEERRDPKDIYRLVIDQA